MKILSILIFLILKNSYASMIPANNLHINAKAKSNITEIQFNELIDAIVNEFRVDMLAHGAKKISINKDWKNSKVNASASNKENHFKINVYGGLARHKLINLDSLTLVICHELGHLIGGAPTWKPFNIASSEGQADYFATLKCFRRVLKHPTQINVKDIHPKARTLCKKQFKNENEFNTCLRSSMAQVQLSKLLKELAGDKDLPSFDTPDPYERMFILFNGYPNNQCRLDTLFAGSLCVNDTYQMLDMEKYNQGVCNIYQGDTIGIRPKCWYVPRVDS